jgi:hypothetical protein
MGRFYEHRHVVGFAEISAFDEVSIRMRLQELTQPQIGFTCDYVRVSGPLELQAALEPYSASRLAEAKA